MIDPLVRSANEGDGDQLLLLETEARAALVDQRGGRRWLDTHPTRIDWTVDDLATRTMVAHIDDAIVGYITVTIDLPVARVDTVYVTPMARELGFGDALLAAVLDAAREAGACLLEGEALPGDRNTKNLYERAGIKARLITVSTDL